MKTEDLTHLSDQELAKELKNRKNGFVFMSIIFGAMVGMAILNNVTSGVNFFTFFPILFTPVVFNSRTKFKAAEKETDVRLFT